VGKLTWEKVRLARMFYVTVGLSQKEIAQRLGVTQSYIAQLSYMRIWIEDTPVYRVPNGEDYRRLHDLWLSPEVTDDALREAFLAVAEQAGVITAAKARANLEVHRAYSASLARISTDPDGYVTRRWREPEEEGWKEGYDFPINTDPDGYVISMEGVSQKGDWKDYPGLRDAIHALIDRIVVEMERVWGPETQGFDGTTEQYTWLKQHYGISEEDDVQWQFILQDSWDEEPDDLDDDDGEMREFLASPHAIVGHLNFLLERYRSNTVSYTDGTVSQY
jgi:transcriptional regulator with XRE-family HTH domain